MWNLRGRVRIPYLPVACIVSDRWRAKGYKLVANEKQSRLLY
jgi:hypothetical protein